MMIEDLRMLVGVTRVACFVDIVLIDVPTVEPECKVSIVHHVAPSGTERILSPKFNVIEFPIDTHPIPVLDVGFKDEVVDVII